MNEPRTSESGELPEAIRVALLEMLGSYESLARLCASEQVRPLEQTMNWDGPICARRVLKRPERWEERRA